MNRNDYIELLDRALASAHGIKLDYGDDRTAHLIRGKLYRIREELRAEDRTEPATEPVVAYDANGNLKGVLDILRRRAPAAVPYDALTCRVWQGALYICPVEVRPRRVDRVE